MPSIATVTMNPAIDLAAVAERVLPEHKTRCRDLVRFPGGGGINVSRALVRLGGESAAIYPMGGPGGDLLERLLTREKIQPRVPIPIDGHTRESLTVTEEASGLQWRFSLPGPRLRESEWRQCLTAIGELDPHPEYVVLSGSLPPGVPADFYARVSRQGQAQGHRVIVDASGEALREASRAGVYLLKPNLRELSHLVERKLRNEEEQEEAAREICRHRRAQAVVVSLGAAGALLVTEKETRRLRSPTVPIGSRVGAGDSMVAGIVLALSRGASLPVATAHGVAAGAAAVMTPGTELCHHDDYAELLRIILREAGLEDA
ncbi:MAG: hexose kinase [Candidatus Eisenbacteria bacterium]|nr:hexose kinase [Candidatus Eisenbacteria bacterium]